MTKNISKWLAIILGGIGASLTFTACMTAVRSEATSTPVALSSIVKPEPLATSQASSETSIVTSLPSPTAPLPVTSTVSFTPVPLLSLSPVITDTYGALMVLVPAGPFEMGEDPGQALAHCVMVYGKGSCSNDWFDDEGPVHLVTLNDYYIDQYEVTNASYAQCIKAGICDPPSDTYYLDNLQEYGHYPVTRVNWYQAETYCTWRGARVPTEAEWEKAARGTDGRIYPWGDQAPTDSRFSNGGSRKYTQLMLVGSFPDGVSPYGVYDMVGSVWEWVADWYDAVYYSRSPSLNPPGPPSGEERIVRGGAWQPDGVNARAANRAGSQPTNTFNMLGFRCASSPKLRTE